jgi:hypothetical protein
MRRQYRMITIENDEIHFYRWFPEENRTTESAYPCTVRRTVLLSDALDTIRHRVAGLTQGAHTQLAVFAYKPETCR